MNKDNTLITKDLDYKSPEEYKIYSPLYTPDDKSQKIDNQSNKFEKYFYIECYGC